MSVCWSRIAVVLLALCVVPGCAMSQAELFRKQNEGIAIGRQVALTVPGLNDADRKQIVERPPLLHVRYITSDWRMGSYQWFLDGNRVLGVGFGNNLPAKPADCGAGIRQVSADDSDVKRAVKLESRVPEARQLAMASPGLTEADRSRIRDRAPRFEVYDLPYLPQSVVYFIWTLEADRVVSVYDSGQHRNQYTVSVDDFSKTP